MCKNVTSFFYYIQCGRNSLFWACKIHVAQLLINEGANVDLIDNVSSLILGLHCSNCISVYSKLSHVF